MTEAGQRWRRSLAGWAIPEPVLAAAPDDPFGIPAELFHPRFQACAGLSTSVARDALGPGGSVLDVGCAGGAASVRLVPPAESITGVDANLAMVQLFARVCRERSITGLPVAGRWPDIAGQVKPHDVAVSHHVAYNVGEIEDYLLSLNARARRRVVLEVTAIHPQATLNHLWQHLHGVQRPQTPTADDLVAVLRELGLAPHVEPTRRPVPPTPQPRDLLVSFTRRRLCLDHTADPEIDRLLPADFTAPPPEAVCIWWDSDSRIG
jgi:precorrin-6B methylase 2